MGRWEPGAGDRLRQAALELFVEQGYDRTTVADIAGRAGVTSRTFFRYFADKREVLFAGGSELQEVLLAALEQAPPDAAPLQAVEAAFHAVEQVIADRAWSARRQTVIAAHAELRERELIKLSQLSAALADGLRRRDVAGPVAELAAETGVTVFRLGFERWVSGPPGPGLAQVLSASFADLRALTGHA